MTFLNTEARINYLEFICEQLQDTSSLNEKRDIINTMEDECKDDFNFIIEILANKYPLGYKYDSSLVIPCNNDTSNITLREYLKPLWEPSKNHNLSIVNCINAMRKVNINPTFIESIVNRELRLGIGTSLLEKTSVSPMLAKKFEGKLDFDAGGYYITEKLDGNRCIAQYVNGQWQFTSRNGKPMHVDFDMRGLSKEFVYDGEVMTRQQTIKSQKLYENVVKQNKVAALTDSSTIDFRSASGLINRHDTNKDLVYNIFDVANCNVSYKDRRIYLNDLLNFGDLSNEVRILPVLNKYTNCDEICISKLLDFVTSQGAEGLMINYGSAKYQNKRTGSLLKYKQVQTIDMKVIDWEYGIGKYEGMVGYLVCEILTNDCKYITCKVGTGFTDEQRLSWALKPELILNKIIEVAYFSLSQNMNTDGTKTYSLRFPRMKSIRSDKIITSEY